MPLRTIASLAIAILLGLVAVLMVRGYLQSQRNAVGPVASGATVPVVVAAGPLARGVALTPQVLRVAAYPKESAPAGAFASPDQLTGKAGPARILLQPVVANEPVLNSMLNGPGAKGGLAGVIDAGMRAVSVRTNDVAGVGGFVLPGDHVDVIVTRSIGSGEAQSTVAQALAENALVLGVDQTSDVTTDKPVVTKTVTVEVTPDQAQAISLAQSVGQMTLSLRRTADDGPLSRKAMTVADLGFGHAAPVAKAKVVRPRPTPGLSEVHVVRGVESSAYSVGGF